MFLNVIKANAEIGKLSESLKAVTTEKNALVAKLTEFESKNKQSTESNVTVEALAEEHKKEIESLKEEYDAKLTAKDTELAKIKAESEKTISTVKESVAKETIAIVASQGTNAVIETVLPVPTEKEERQCKYKYTSVSFLNANK
jgi:peptidoglycan hydrolase CwlO-like protein